MDNAGQQPQLRVKCRAILTGRSVGLFTRQRRLGTLFTGQRRATQLMSKKLHIKTWGCQMNEYDSSKMADLLGEYQGYTLTEEAEEADILLLNTCSIREKAQEKVFHQLGRWKTLKDKNPDLIIGVGGCVASQEGKAIKDRAHCVDIIFGPQTLHRLPEMIEQVRRGDKAVIDVSFPEIEKFDRLPEPRAEGPTAFVSIMEGCSKYCSFCVVPYTRGEEVSRPSDDIILEIAQLAEQGVREVNQTNREILAESLEQSLAPLVRALVESNEKHQGVAARMEESNRSVQAAHSQLDALINKIDDLTAVEQGSSTHYVEPESLAEARSA